MTGRASGKLELEKANVFLLSEKERIELKKAVVYVHLKGYSLARVTHLDIEHHILDNIIPSKRGKFLSIHGIKNGIEIILDDEKEIGYKNEKINVRGIEVTHPLLVEILGEDGKTRTWVGGKFGGIYIGFKKNEIGKLERIAEREFGMKPV